MCFLCVNGRFRRCEARGRPARPRAPEASHATCVSAPFPRPRPSPHSVSPSLASSTPTTMSFVTAEELIANDKQLANNADFAALHEKYGEPRHVSRRIKNAKAGLEAKNHAVSVVNTSAEALALIKSLIPEGSEVHNTASQTLVRPISFGTVFPRCTLAAPRFCSCFAWYTSWSMQIRSRSAQPCRRWSGEHHLLTSFGS